LLDHLDAWLPELAEIEQARGDAFAILVRYLFRVVDPSLQDALHHKLYQLGQHAKEITMTIAEHLEEEGRKKGRREASISMLRALLKLKFQLPMLDDVSDARLCAATPEMLDRYAQRVLTAPSLAAVFDEADG
jgi:hypothetical protein